MTVRCEASRIGDGSPCGSVIVVDCDCEQTHCFSHCPDREADRRRARARGGAESSNVARIRRVIGRSRLGPVLDVLEAALTEVHDGSLSAPRASAMASIARSIVQLVEVAELEERLVDLERRWSA